MEVSEEKGFLGAIKDIGWMMYLFPRTKFEIN